MNINLFTKICGLVLVVLSWTYPASAQKQNNFKGKKSILKIADRTLNRSVKQYKLLMQNVPPDQLPRTFEKDRVFSVSPYSWISGFYPGTLLYLYEFSKDTVLLNEAAAKLKLLEPIQRVTANHDLGFMMYCSYGNAYRLYPRPEYKDILIQSAKSLATRFDPTVGSIKSWDRIKSLDGERMLNFPVIIDNMMNLELLFFASRATGDLSYKEIALRHIESTIKNHLRQDYGSYHVVNYDEETGEVKSRETQQGFSDNSTWSRGQAWGIYGFTMAYRETGDKEYLEVAQKMAGFFLNHPNLPKDKIPYWDFNVGQPGYTPEWNYDPALRKEVPRDASAAAIVASALIELSSYTEGNAGKKYLRAAETMLRSLSSPAYSAAEGKNGGFILMHSSGGVPGNVEVDVPTSYADYYFVEALMRYRNLSH